MISASAVNLARRCLRRAAFKYGSDVVPEPEPESDAIRTGKDGHAILEAYQKEGWSPPQTPLGDLCRKGLPWLPHPGQATAEGLFNVTISGVPYLGYMDLETDNARVFPGTTTLDGCIPGVIDYKFSKDPERYGILTPADFLRDPQALLYAAYTFAKYGTSVVFLRWLKFRTQGKPKIFPVDALLTRQEVVRAFGKVVHPAATALVHIRTKNNDPNSFAPNFEACHDFGRPCPYLGQCDTRSDRGMTLLDEMRALVGPGVAEAAQGPQAINPPVELTKPPTTTHVHYPLRIILEELGSALTRAAARV